jgi:hypothetical protein
MGILGRKDDNGKLQWGLMPFSALRGAVRVMMFGAEKYGDFNWKHVDNPVRRYFDAMMRHITAYADGEEFDTESGMPHLWHAMCCLIFLVWHLDNKKGETYDPLYPDTEECTMRFYLG